MSSVSTKLVCVSAEEEHLVSYKNRISPLASASVSRPIRSR
jgi:hypothetical protein